ncbi:MAG: DUF4424 domain-containing protein [Rhizobiaceae bacterium]
MKRWVMLAAGFALAFLWGGGASFANDTAAELKTGGLVFVRSDAIEMEEEELFISMDEIRVDYIFRNRTDEDVRSIVAFPMPEIPSNPYTMVATPWLGEGVDPGDNIFGFAVEIDGAEVEPQLEMRATAVNLDVTNDLMAAGIPVNHLKPGIDEQLAALDDETKADWIARGILHHDFFEDGDTRVDHYWPLWSLRATYWWWSTFPAHERMRVSHRYTPSVGGTAGVSFLEMDGSPGGYDFDGYQRRYCMEPSFLRALENATKQSGGSYPPFSEAWLSYVLTTGGNWAGPIGRFTLTIDKGATENFVSFCGEGVEKIGPTTFRMVKEDFYPERDLEVLIMRRLDPQ